MSWTLRDYKQQGTGRAEYPLPPAVPVDDSEPLPTYIASQPDTDEEELREPTPSMEQVMAKEGFLTAQQLAWWSHLQRRGIEASREETDPDAPVPVRRSAHELPPGWRP